jgi:hypothetical protein
MPGDAQYSNNADEDTYRLKFSKYSKERVVEQTQGKYEAVMDFVVKAILVRLSALK